MYSVKPPVCILYLRRNDVWLLALDAKAELERELAADSAMPAIKQLESRECVGMFEYRKDEEQLLFDNLIAGKCELCFGDKQLCSLT